MAWDLTQPTNTTKIRNLGTVIRPNWVAIAEADSSFLPYAINLVDRTNAAISPEDPATIAKSSIAYSKQDSNGDTQAYCINSTDAGSSQIYQLSGNRYTETTNSGTAGGTLYGTSFYTTEGERIVEYSGLTASHSGNYTVLFPAAYPWENYTVLYSISAVSGVGGVSGISVGSVSTAGFTIVFPSSTTVYWRAVGRISN